MHVYLYCLFIIRILLIDSNDLNIEVLDNINRPKHGQAQLIVCPSRTHLCSTLCS